MKIKKVTQTIICILMAVLAVSLAACESDNGVDDKVSSDVSTAASTGGSESSAYEDETKPRIENTEPESGPIYYHAAICGAVVTEQDGLFWSSFFVTFQPNFCYRVI